MLKTRVLDALNAQIQKEIESAYIYLGMAAYFDGMNFPGFSHWMKIQYEEEMAHAFKIYHYINSRGEKVILEAIAKPSVDFSSPLEVFEAALEHEQYISRSINDLYTLAKAENDYATQQFLHWFIEEQVEEEENAGGIVDTLNMVKDHPQALLMLDRELAQRPLPSELEGEE